MEHILKDQNAIIIGFIGKKLACQLDRESAAIAIDQKGLIHIEARHSNELEKIGLTALDFAAYVAQNFNEIRKGNKNELFIIVSHETISNAAVIRLKEVEDKNFYMVETATPMRKGYINKKELLWKRSAP